MHCKGLPKTCDKKNFSDRRDDSIMQHDKSQIPVTHLFSMTILISLDEL